MKTINFIVEKALKDYEIIPNKSLKSAKNRFLKDYLENLLFLCYGNISMAAEKAKINRRQLHRLLKKFEIDAKKIRQELIKPSIYFKENLVQVIDSTKLNEEKKDISDNLKDIFDDLKNIDFPYEVAINDFEKELINLKLKENQYNFNKTANELEISIRTLYRKIRI